MPHLSPSIRAALKFEARRKRLITQGKFAAARRTYEQQTDFLPDENTGQFWDDYYHQSPHRVEYPMETWKLNRVLRELDLGQSILNLGVGDGKLEARVAARAARPVRLTGVDFTKKLLPRLRKRFPQFTFRFQSSLEGLAFQANSFDQVLLLEVLEHIIPKNTFAVLGQAYRVLKPGGKLLLSVPINEGLEEMLPVNPNSHMRLYSEPLLRFELEQAGFRIEKVYRASAFPRFFRSKHFLNSLLRFRPPNNLLVVARKSAQRVQ
jgi:SAM-dependent methyltransferase